MDTDQHLTDQEPTQSDLMGARVLNMFGLLSPVSNVALLQLAPKEIRWMGVGAGVILWVVGGFAATADITWLSRSAFGLHYVLVLLGLIDPRWPITPFRWWIAFGHLLGKVVAIPVFALTFYLAVTPLALLMRAMGKDPLQRSAPPGESYWEDHEPPPKEKFERQF